MAVMGFLFSGDGFLGNHWTFCFKFLRCIVPGICIIIFYLCLLLWHVTFCCELLLQTVTEGILALDNVNEVYVDFSVKACFFVGFVTFWAMLRKKHYFLLHENCGKSALTMYKCFICFSCSYSRFNVTCVKISVCEKIWQKHVKSVKKHINPNNLLRPRCAGPFLVQTCIGLSHYNRAFPVKKLYAHSHTSYGIKAAIKQITSMYSANKCAGPFNAKSNLISGWFRRKREHLITLTCVDRLENVQSKLRLTTFYVRFFAVARLLHSVT